MKSYILTADTLNEKLQELMLELHPFKSRLCITGTAKTLTSAKEYIN